MKRPASAFQSAAVLLVIGLAVVVAGGEDEDEERFVGWKGDTYRGLQQEGGGGNEEAKHLWVEQISWRPRAYILHNLITKEEARHIVELSWITMEKSATVGDNGTFVVSNYRTSYNTFLPRHMTPVVKAVQQRVASIVRVPVQYQEDMQVLRYGVGQYYHAHQDPLDNDSPRMATVLIYLYDVDEGGETSFPDSDWISPESAAAHGGGLSDCAKGHVAFRPRRGDGLLFYSTLPDGTTLDDASMHEGCPVLRGAKWTGTVWVHTKPVNAEAWDEALQRFDTENKGPSRDPGLCQDTEPSCQEWANGGECAKNPDYMKSACPNSCQVCTPCTGPDDAECLLENRRLFNLLEYDPTPGMDWS